MSRTELAIWIRPGEAPQRGVVVKRGSTATAAVTVEWESGRQERVAAKDNGVLFAYEGTQRLDWIVNRGQLEEQLKKDPAGVFTAVIRDEGKAITTATIKKRLAELGIDPARVSSAFDRAKPGLKANRHILIKGSTHTWSDVPVDPFAHLRQMRPLDALEHLLTASRLKPEEKAALGDAIRAGLS